MRRLLLGTLAAATLMTAGIASAHTVTPELAIMRYWTSAGTALYVKQTDYFFTSSSCGTNCTRFIADYEMSSPRQNEIQLRMKSNSTLMPTQESCWYYDHDGPNFNWRPTTDGNGCMHYTHADGKQRTWMSESADLKDGGYSYWTVHNYTYGGTAKPYMAYGFYENSTWNWIWVYAGGYVPIV